MDEWVNFMEKEIIPFQISKGMVITGSFRGEKDDTTYIWLRRFEDEKSREKLYKDVYESDHWKNTIAQHIPDLLDRDGMIITRIVPTLKSTSQ